MTKYSFLNELDQLLSGLDVDERKEILEDYEEHFAFAKRADKSDDEVIALVGTPKAIASEILGSKVEGDSSEEIRLDNEAQAEALEEQAKAIEAKLAAQAKALEAQAEALEAKLEAQQEAQEERAEREGSFVEDIIGQAGSFVEDIIGQAGSFVDQAGAFVGNISESISEAAFENAVESGTLIEEIVDMSGVKNVVIHSRNQKVEIEKTTYPTARVRLTKGMLNLKVEGDTLYIESREIKRKFGVGVFISIEFPAELKVELPEAVYHLIQAKTANAKIEIDSFELDKLDLESVNGKLEVSGIVAPELKLKTTNGKIEVRDSKGHVDAQTTNGKIELRGIDGIVCAKTTNSKIELQGITGDVTAKTTNGKIDFENDTINQNVNLGTSNAKIEMKLLNKPENAKFELSTSHSTTKLFGTTRNYDVFGDGLHVVNLSTSNAKIEVYQKMD